jgi:hypothetical protein
MSPPFIERRHRNHAIARVSFDPKTGAYGASATTAGGEQQSVGERFSGPDAETCARAAADALAHPMCMGVDCAPWQSGSRVNIRPAQASATPPKPRAASLPGELATGTRDARTFIERTHGNGVVARVSRLRQFDTFQATAYHVTPGDLPVNPVLMSAEDDARVAADHMAHPHCTGQGCEGWPPAPWTKPKAP